MYRPHQLLFGVSTDELASRSSIRLRSGGNDNIPPNDNHDEIPLSHNLYQLVDISNCLQSGCDGTEAPLSLMLDVPPSVRSELLPRTHELHGKLIEG